MLVGFGSAHIRRAIETNPPMAREEEVAVARRAAKGDRRAADRLVLCNLGIAVAIARKYVRTDGPLFDDVMQYAVIGLCRARDRFNPEKGIRFCSYACWWIRAELDRGLGQNERLVRRSAKDGLRALAFGAHQDRSLNALVPGSDDLEFIDLIEAGGEDAETAMDRARREATIRGRVGRLALTSIEREIVRERLIRDHADGATLAEVGERNGISRERVRQLELSAKEKLRGKLKDLAA